jgi:hypothetical protein
MESLLEKHIFFISELTNSVHFTGHHHTYIPEPMKGTYITEETSLSKETQMIVYFVLCGLVCRSDDGQ